MMGVDMGATKGWFWLAVVIVLLAGCSSGGPTDCPIPTEMMSGTHEGLVPYTIQNDSCTTFCDISISPTRCDDWGFDWIRGDSLRSGESITVYLQPGKYDVLVEDCSDYYYEFDKEVIDGENSLVLRETNRSDSQSCQASVTVLNQTDVPICHMWIATDDSESFGGNWLGSEQIGPGEKMQFYVVPDTYDIKAEDCDFIVLRVEIDVEVNSPIEWLVE
jgi:hypothetical protein